MPASRGTVMPLPKAVAAGLAAPLLARHAATIEGLCLPSIRLQERSRADAAIPIGASKLGGRPDLPPGIEWPTLKVRAPQASEELRRALSTQLGTPPPRSGPAPLSFVAQIRLDQVATHDMVSLLPGRGMLYFFHCDTVFESDGERGADDWSPCSETEQAGIRYRWYMPGAARCRVIHHDGNLADLSRIDPPEENGEFAKEYSTFSLEFGAELTLPQAETSYVGNAFPGADRDSPVRLTREEQEAYFEVAWRDATRIAQMLGHPDQAQPFALESGWFDVRAELFPEVKGDVPMDAAYHRDGRVLLQLGGHQDHWTALYFGIRLDDLRRGDFSRVWATTQR